MPCDWLFVDGSSLIFRAFHGVPRSVRSPDGRPVNAIRGFVDTLARLLATRRPRRLAVASDEDWRPAWRVELIPSYKAHRTAEPVPPDLEPQMPLIHAVLAAIGIDFVGAPDHEAEDVIATWTARASGTVEIVSGDRDLFALIEDPRVCVLYPEKGGMTIVTEAEVTRRYGIPGRSYADFAILRGDPSDGLPGLRGVGAVAAAALIRRHGDVAGLLREGRLADDQREYLTRALRVVAPAAALPVALPAGRRDSYPVDPAELEELVRTHGLGSACDRLVQALLLNLRSA
ncbi:MAG: 5'-3' exonuclease [Candidatus Dormibacteria bacterium]